MLWIILILIISGLMWCVPYIFNLIGLSAIGPIAGSWFASMMGSGIAAGSIMATMQSFVMSGWVLVFQPFAIIFWIITSIFMYMVKNKHSHNS